MMRSCKLKGGVINGKDTRRVWSLAKLDDNWLVHLVELAQERNSAWDCQVCHQVQQDHHHHSVQSVEEIGGEHGRLQWNHQGFEE